MNGELGIWIAPYNLVAKRNLSSRAQSRTREGALLLLEEQGGEGFADIHPWPELGDRPLNEQIKCLEDGTLTPLLQRSLKLARLDLQARLCGESAFAGLSIPESHALVVDAFEAGGDEFDRLAAEGFRILKLKLGRDLLKEARRIEELAARGFRLRLDFNATPDVETISGFLGSLSTLACKQIDFIEDPCPWNLQDWRRLTQESGVSLALDRAVASEAEIPSASGGFDWLVLKPAVQELEVVANWRLCVTSYLDHPVGQMGAALEAARLKASSCGSSLGICGLLSHRVFEPNEFSETIATQGPTLLPPTGTGIGFDHILSPGNRTRSLNWKRLR